MVGQTYGSEALELSEEVQEELRERVDEYDRGLFSKKQMKYVLGIREFDDTEAGQKNRTSTKHAVRRKVRSGIVEVSTAALLLPPEEWEHIIAGKFPFPTERVKQPTSGQLEELIPVITLMIATIDHTTDNISENSESTDIRPVREGIKNALLVSDYTKEVKRATADSASNSQANENPVQTEHTPFIRFWELYIHFQAGRISRKQYLAHLMQLDADESE
jgi:hypothetical protein